MDFFTQHVNGAKASAICNSRFGLCEAGERTKRKLDFSLAKHRTYTKKLKSGSKENYMPYLNNHQAPQIFEQSYESTAAKQTQIRRRLIHILAIQPFRMTELKSRLSAGGITREERLVVSSLIPLVTRVERKLYHLKCNVWDDVDVDWLHYTDEERQKVKLRKCLHSASPPKIIGEDSKTTRLKIQQFREDNEATNPLSHSIQLAKNGCSNRYVNQSEPLPHAADVLCPERRTMSSVRNANNSRELKKYKSQLNEVFSGNTTINDSRQREQLRLLASFQPTSQQHFDNEVSDSAQNFTRDNNNISKPSNKQGLPEPVTSRPQLEEKYFVRRRTNSDRHSSLRAMSRRVIVGGHSHNNASTSLPDEKHSMKTANAQVSEIDMNAVRSRNNVETETKRDEQQQQEQPDPYRPWDENEVTDLLITLMDEYGEYRKTEDLTAYEMLVKRNLDLAAKLPIFNADEFPRITKENQRRQYIAEFKRTEDLYKRLLEHNKALTSQFWFLRGQFEAAEECSEEHIEIYTRYHRCYHSIYSDNELKNRAYLDYLHELRKHLFQRVTEYDNPLLAVMAKEQQQYIDEEVRERVLNSHFMVTNLIALHPIESIWFERETDLSDISSESELDDEDDGQHKQRSSTIERRAKKKDSYSSSSSDSDSPDSPFAESDSYYTGSD